MKLFSEERGNENPTDLNLGEVICLSIIYLILDLIYCMVTIFIFNANHQDHQFVNVMDLSQALVSFGIL